MSEPGSHLPAPTDSSNPMPPRRKRRILVYGGLLATLLVASLAGLYFWASSAAFEGFMRKRLVALIEQSTGGRVEIASFHWRLLNFEANAGGLVIHGLEAPGEAPYARVDHLRVRWSLLGLWSPRVLLRDLDVSGPEFHLIVYPDGSTNQPHPTKTGEQGEAAIDTLFDLQAGHVSVERGVLDYENRAASFDFQNRYALLDFDARDVSLLISYVPAGAPSQSATTNVHSPAGQESYHIEAGATDLNLKREKDRPIHGFMQATLDLTRSAVHLRLMRITSNGRATKGQKAIDHTLEVSGVLEDFAHPRWQAKVTGDLDMELLEPVFGYPFAPAGLAHLDLDGAGEAGEFRADGGIHIDGGSYIGSGVVATGVRMDAHVHADPKQLLITSIVAHLRQGGQMEGEIALGPWLPTIPGAAELQPRAKGAQGEQVSPTTVTPLHPPPAFIPVNGKVTAQFKDVALDTLLDMVGQAPFQRLGLDTRVNGPAIANWSKGDAQTVAVTTNFNLIPPARGVQGEVPASGTLDATYTQQNGAVNLRNLELHTPASELTAHGKLGAYPLTSPSEMDVDFHSHNLWEFDTVLHDLGLNRYGKTGAAALPVALAGQADLHGSWAGSLFDPHIAGNLKASQLSVEMLPIQTEKPGQAKSTKPQIDQPGFVRWDTVEATGSYSADRVVIDHSVFNRGKAQIALSGTLEASPGREHARTFDANSTLHMHLQASKVGVEDLLPLTGHNLPLTGVLNAQLQADGLVNMLGGSGWVELDGGTVFGEPVSRIRAQGTMANQVIKLASLTVSDTAGNIAATGILDLKSRRLQLDAHGSGIDVARIQWLHQQGLEATGSLGFAVTGSGTLDDPRMDAHATVKSLGLSGEPMGDLDFAANTANRYVTYNANTRLAGAELSIHGQTALSGDYVTQAKLNFSQFNIGALLKMAHVESISGQSALAGTVAIEGPLAHLDQLRGEARLQQLAVTLAGVHLESQGGAHATLANSRIILDPLHVTGEETDLQAQGRLDLTGKQQLDIAAAGSVNLKLAETLDPDLTASGTTTFQVEAHGPLKNPGLQGRVDFQNASLSLEDVPNGLSQLHGTLEFNQNRLEVKSLTAMSGGGLLSVAGYLAYQHGLYADLSVNGNGIRIRYPQGVSSLADATLHLQGSQNNLLLSGNVLITRFTVSPDLDITALAAQANSVQSIAPPDAPSNHIRLDVHLVSSPQLNFQNAYAKLAGDVDLRLRGTVASPSLLGRVSITEGSATIAGTRYDLQRGDITFSNPVRIEPSIDLNATARVEDYDITLGLHGTPQKLAVTYRSDPPLAEADVAALLALGRTESQQRLYTQQQEQTGANPTTDALLGGALNATVSSRVQKLFGAGSVKVDPNYLSFLGNSTSRITVEEQLGRNLTLTYATNVNTTGQQLIQAEIAINRHVSLLVARDESGVFSMVIKATRRYR